MKTVDIEKTLIDKLVEEYTEYVEEVKLAKITLKNKCSSCTLYFQQSLQSTLELVLILFIFICT